MDKDKEKIYDIIKLSRRLIQLAQTLSDGTIVTLSESKLLEIVSECEIKKEELR